ncbi:unnamed protein product [Brassica rapa subsp. trilocularis]|uniref:(rape) hypothetical protein n=1 Tax=Brassica napus TaxID=3708 RepID=A0A816WNG6_BRANA|nr:unnamed protein product [Brassica napus]
MSSSLSFLFVLFYVLSDFVLLEIFFCRRRQMDDTECYDNNGWGCKR